jgi:hypothetical protein
MNAYDASGIDGISWEYEQVAARPAIGSLEVTPGDLRVSDLGPGWIVMRARDKAGNLSLPLRVPVYGRMPARKSPP